MQVSITTVHNTLELGHTYPQTKSLLNQLNQFLQAAVHHLTMLILCNRQYAINYLLTIKLKIQIKFKGMRT